MAKYYYNGVLLPEIPADVVVNYPYACIRKNTATGYYDLFLTGSLWYFKNTFITPAAGYSAPIKWYQVPIANAESEPEWIFTKDSTGTFTISETGLILWSNHDIPNGSATATAIYFYSTYPIPEADECYYNGVRLPNIPNNTTINKYKYLTIIRYNNPVGEPDYYLYASINKPYKYDGEQVSNTTAYIKIPSGGRCRYLCASGETEWSFNSEATTEYNANQYNFTIIWSNCDIPDGSATSTAIYFYGNSPTPVVSGADKPSAYLIRSGSTLYTVTDGALTALAETEITASLFQTYGVDEIPDGTLLVGLTDPEILYWQDSTDELPSLSLTVKGTPPLPQMFTSKPMDLTHESIAGISHAAVDASEDVRFAISFDGGTTWKAHDGSAWFDTSDTVPGMLPSTMNAITAEQWAQIVTLTAYRLRFWLPNVTAYVKSVVMHYINP